MPILPPDALSARLLTLSTSIRRICPQQTTYVKQVAVNALLAHTGCYVAAEFASFRLLDRVFTRMGDGDASEANASTFLQECRQLSHLLSHATKSSLCIIDELVRAKVAMRLTQRS